jgi:ABC-2 type transport system permease protein
MIKFWSISHNTFVQTIRQPIFMVLLLVTFGVLLLEVPLAGWTMAAGDFRTSDQKLLESLGLSTLLVSGLLIAAFSASGVLSREIEDRTALTVIAKPVSRATFVAGKFAGVSAAVALAFYLCMLVFLMTVRHRVMSSAADPFDMPVITLGVLAFSLAILIGLAGNYVFGWHFNSASVWSATILFTVAMGILLFVGKGWVIVPIGWDSLPGPTNMDAAQVITTELLKAVLMMFMAVVIFCAVAVAASTRLGQVMTLLVCLIVFVVGSLVMPTLIPMCKTIPALYALVWLAPNLSYFYGLDALTMGKTIPLDLIGLFALYCICYTAAVLSAGIALFQTRELESQAGASTISGLVGILAWAGRAAALGLAIWGCILISQIYLPGATWTNLALAGVALIVCACGIWVLFGSFARGAKWSYWMVMAVAALTLAYAGLAYFVPRVKQMAYPHNDNQQVISAIISAAVLLILILPKSRQHFQISLFNSKPRTDGR